MGDRCSLSVTFAAHDADKVATAFGFSGDELQCSIEDTKSPVWDLSIDEINYGGTDELDSLASSGVWFKAYHGAGCDYAPELVVGYKGRTYYVTTDTSDNILCVVDEELGRPRARTLNCIRKFLRIIKIVNEYLHDIQLVNREWKRGKRGGGAVCR
jgi:hypothetical protein